MASSIFHRLKSERFVVLPELLEASELVEGRVEGLTFSVGLPTGRAFSVGRVVGLLEGGL